MYNYIFTLTSVRGNKVKTLVDFAGICTCVFIFLTTFYFLLLICSFYPSHFSFNAFEGNNRSPLHAAFPTSD